MKKIFVFLAILLLSIVMIAVALVSFFCLEPQYTITSGMICLFSVVAILIIFDSIESLNVANVISLQKKVKDKSNEIESLTQENNQLRNQFISVINTSLSNKQLNQFNIGIDSNGLIVKKAREEDLKEKVEQTETSSDASETTNGTSYANRRLYAKKLESTLLELFCEKFGISEKEIQRDMKITSVGKSFDPITKKDIIYDGYLRRPVDELFIEVSPSFSPSSMFDYRFYFMISGILHYTKANQCKAKMILILPKYSKEYMAQHPQLFRYYSYEEYLKNLNEIYAPARENGLLEIVEIDISDEEISKIEESIKQNKE